MEKKMKITSMNTISFEAQKAEAQVVDKNKKGHKKEKKYVWNSIYFQHSGTDT